MGFQTPQQAQQAIKQLDQSYIDTSKIEVRRRLSPYLALCLILLQVTAAQSYGDESIPRAWSKFSAGSSGYQQRQQKKAESASLHSKLNQDKLELQKRETFKRDQVTSIVFTGKFSEIFFRKSPTKTRLKRKRRWSDLCIAMRPRELSWEYRYCFSLCDFWLSVGIRRSRSHQKRHERLGQWPNQCFSSEICVEFSLSLTPLQRKTRVSARFEQVNAARPGGEVGFLEDIDNHLSNYFE